MGKVLVVGGGASGMAAALSAALEGAEVLLLEQNEKLGKKVYITGKGRCNVTNACAVEDLFSHAVTNAKFLYSAFHRFTNLDLMTLLEQNGCPLVVERGNRVFPASMHASDVIRCFEKMLRDAGVKILLNTRVHALKAEEGRVVSVEAGKQHFDVDAVILASGGISYPATGSTGDGFRFSEKLGHTVTPLYPSLVSLNTSAYWCKDLSGLTLRNVTVKAVDAKGKTIRKEEGELLFTHKGVSGPTILRLSAYLTKRVHQGESFHLFIDLKPALGEDVLDARLLREFSGAGTKEIKNFIGNLVPQALGRVILEEAGIPLEKRACDVTKEERAALLRTLKGLRLTVTGTGGFDEAIVTQGGISVKEIDASTMRSRLYENLFFAGEIIDVDLMTGGFSLQEAWSTGWLSGKNAAAEAASRNKDHLETREQETQDKEEKQMGFNVAIDGPAGAGKSTIAKLVAKELRLLYVDTGAMYRTIGLYMLKQDIDIHDEEAVTAALPDVSVTLGYDGKGLQRLYLNGEDVTDFIRTPEVSEAASVTSAYPEVREKLLDLQHDLARKNDVVMDGRDIGTVILPDAQVKIFLTASVRVRALRRMKELVEKGEEVTLESVEEEIRERDYRDSHRETAPLKQAEDAILVDTSSLSIEEVVSHVTGLIRPKMEKRG
ncbi:MAG: (d)CMP kinase [Lachnospiraceae bacterium]|nr:(d)CMP kinase [Lachnospiraceae bacterium]